jgi:serine protease Do
MMNQPDQNSVTKQGLRKFRRAALAVTAVALMAVGGLGLALGKDMHFASAESEQTPQTAQTLHTPTTPLSFADLVQRVTPAVVSINVKADSKVAEHEAQIPGLPDLPEDNPLYDFFKRFRQGQSNGQDGHPAHPHPTMAQGSGFFISPDGYLVTNNHVVENAEDVSITLENGDKFPATLIGADARTDVALLKVKASQRFPYVKFSDKDPRVGDWVLAVGNPFGLGGTVTAGIISAHNRDIGSGPYDYLQIDAAVNPCNSGGPSFNLNGEVVGMNTAIFSPSGENVGIAFDVPAPLVKEVVGQLQEHGTVDRGWLGVAIQDVTDDIADSVGLPEAKGAMIAKVAEDGPAAMQDIKAGDVIVEVNGEKVNDSRDLARKIAELHSNTNVKLSTIRYGDKHEVNMKLSAFPSGKKLAALEEDKLKAGEQLDNLGLSLAPATKARGAGDEGVVITEVEPNSGAADKGLKAGDVILQVAGETVSEPAEVASGVKKAMANDKVNVLIQVKTGDQTRFVALSLKKAKA